MALPSFPLHISYPGGEECGGRVRDAGGYDLSDEDVAAINTLPGLLRELAALVLDRTELNDGNGVRAMRFSEWSERLTAAADRARELVGEE